MALDFQEIKKTIIDSVKKAIGDQLSQTTNPATGETYGMVFNARPNPELPVPDYAYAVLDLTALEDVDWYLQSLSYNEDTQLYEYRTPKKLTFQVSVFGGGGMTLANQLATAYRRDDILEILSDGGLGVDDVEQVTILPELLQTDFLEVGIVSLTIRAMDIYSDSTVGSIETVTVTGELTCNLSDEPLYVNASYDPRSFVFTIDTSLLGISESNKFTLPLTPTSKYNIEIDWGDGTSTAYDGFGEDVEHTYPDSGEYTVSVGGEMHELIFNPANASEPLTDGSKIISVNQWGGTRWSNVRQMFNYCLNLVSVDAYDTPDLSNATDLYRLFRHCRSLSYVNRISEWDVSKVTSLHTTFSSALLFDQTLNGWDVSNVTEFFGTFAGNSLTTVSSSFNSSISEWDMSSATTTRYMFFRTSVFNQDISVWDMSNVQQIENMFYSASAFNQPIGVWDLSNVYSRDGGNNYSDSVLELCDNFNQDLSNWPFGQWQTFHDALTNSPSFNQDVSRWDLSNMGSGSDQGLENTFNGTGMSTENYDIALEAWANETYHSTPIGMRLGMSSTQYSTSQQANRDTLTSVFGWEITDAGSV